MTGKSCHSSATNSSSSTAPNTIATANTISSVGGTTTTTSSSSSSTTSSHIQNSLKSLNKASCKISKPLPKSSNPNSASPSPQPAAVSSGSAPPQQSQPPVYNIDKNDFRDVVQKLTGSPAHHQPCPTTPNPTNQNPKTPNPSPKILPLFPLLPPLLLPPPPPKTLTPIHLLLAPYLVPSAAFNKTDPFGLGPSLHLPLLRPLFSLPLSRFSFSGCRHGEAIQSHEPRECGEREGHPGPDSLHRGPLPRRQQLHQHPLRLPNRSL